MPCCGKGMIKPALTQETIVNKKNVEALTTLLHRAEVEAGFVVDQKDNAAPITGLAKWLIDHGAILVPAVITAPQRQFLGQAPADQIVPMLEKIARGES